MKKTIFLSFFLSYCVFNSYAQDPQFTQFNTTPMHINPAYTGMTKHARAFVHARTQWVNIPNNPSKTGRFDTQYFSIDHFNIYSHVGLGLLATKESAGHTGLETINIGLALSREQKIAKNIRLVFAFQTDYWQRTLKDKDLYFADQFNIDTGYSSVPSAENVQNIAFNTHTWNTSAGMLLSHTHFWGGFSIHHLLQGKYLSLLQIEQENTRMLSKYSMEFGVAPPEQKYRLHALFRKQGNSNQLDVGVNYNIATMQGSNSGEANYLIFGLYYRGWSNADAIAPLIRYQSAFPKHGAAWSIAYSYDFTISKLSPTGGTHELTLSIDFNIDEKKQALNLKKKWGCNRDKAKQIIEDYGWSENKWGGTRSRGRKAFPIMRSY